MTDDATPDLDIGHAYEVIRDRLTQQGHILGEKLKTLNQRRLDVFGHMQMHVIGRTRVRTDNNCVPRDILNVGQQLLFGYNVFVGLKSETAVSDVFSLYRIEKTADSFELIYVPCEESFLADPQFVADFKELYRYYKAAYLSQLRNVNGKKLAVFRIGKTSQDVKVFRWSVDAEGHLRYIDNRGERDNIYPPTHGFEWITTTRHDHVLGRHPHVSILDIVFVETIGGNLTLKIENNTEDGLGIYREPVADPHQSLADAQIEYAQLGTLILLKIRPYKETQWRYLIFNRQTQQVKRIDAIGQSCIQLPENQGILFAGGYYLPSGETKMFEGEEMAHMRYRHAIRSPNGEDVLYIFHQEDLGKLVLFSYNLIRKAVQNPIICHGYSLFDDGQLVVFRADDDTPVRIHPMQIWQTPYTSELYTARAPTNGSFLAKIGNADLVRGIAEAYTIKRLLDEQQPTLPLYENLIRSTQKIIDAFHWLGHEEAGDLLTPLQAILATADTVLDEFEKVQVLRKQAIQALTEATQQQDTLFAEIQKPDEWQHVGDFIKYLNVLRRQRGHLITLRDKPYIDLIQLDDLEQALIAQTATLSQATVDFLADDKALQPYHDELDMQLEQIAHFTETQAIVPLQAALDTTSQGLDLLIEMLEGLSIEATTRRTQILEAIATVYAKLNRAKAELALKRKALSSQEAVAEFGAQFKLFSQSVAGALSLADTPEKADEQLSRLLAQLENLAGRFSEFDDFVAQIAEKREEVYAAFEARKQMLLEEKQRQALQLNQAAERILTSITRRAAQLTTVDEQNTYFATDAMVLRVRDLVQKLHDLGDSVKAGDIEARLKATRDQASRELYDKQEIFADDGAVILLGRHRFSVNTQPLDLTLVPITTDAGQQMALHLSGTEFFEPLVDADLDAARAYWDQALISESVEVYRAEYLVATLLFTQDLADLTPVQRREAVRHYATAHYEEGYERGVHDVDAVAILDKLWPLQASAGLLRFSPTSRSLAQLFWAFMPDRARCQIWFNSARSLKQLQQLFGTGWQTFTETLRTALAEAIQAFLAAHQWVYPAITVHQAADYLLEELKNEPLRFTTSTEAMQLAKTFWQALDKRGQYRQFEDDLRALQNTLPEQLALAQAWLAGYVQQTDPALSHYATEAVTIFLAGERLSRQVNSAETQIEIKGLLGQHPRIQNRTLTLRLDEFIERLQKFTVFDGPAFRAYRQLRQTVIAREKARLALATFAAKPLTTFVRNRLINDVYLHFIGDNFAKQMGTLGEQRRTDLMGLLLLISPPGYGKTTLMEYLAQRLGLIFVKINCPTLGHRVIALDPAAAPNATARQELEKLNLALEMGNNVMLYLDDIQHSNPEFLQKFIAMADAQRKIEGIWREKTKTYDFRGKRFCLVMAGNPYTESGEIFKIPDMLANRADIYNLGDILNDKEAIFALSYIENALTSNAVLAPLATRDKADIDKFIRLAQGEEVPTSALSHRYTAIEIQDIKTVLQHLFHLREVIMRVNRQYIASAAQADQYRTEPPFKLQGSYRNMNKLAEKVVAVMNDKEVENLITAHYRSEAQTLTSGAEENLLKLAELRGLLTEEQATRWQAIKTTFNRLQERGDETADPATRVVNQIGLVGEKVQQLQQAITTALEQKAQQSQEIQQWHHYLAALPQLANTLADLKLDVNVVNQMPTGLELVLQKMVVLIDTTLLPIVQEFERKSKLDMAIFERVKDISEMLKVLDKAIAGKTHKQYKPLNLRKD